MDSINVQISCLHSLSLRRWMTMATRRLRLPMEPANIRPLCCSDRTSRRGHSLVEKDRGRLLIRLEIFIFFLKDRRLL